MPQTLFKDEAATPVTPLLDVVLNGLGAIFVLLMVYMALVRPGEPIEPLRFLGDVDPPPAIRSQSYVFTFPVAGGVSGREFSIAGALPRGLHFDSTSGTIYGTPDVAGGDARQPVSHDLRVTVHDGRDRDERTAALVLHPAAVPYPGPLTLTSEERTLRAGRMGVPYEDGIGATGGAPPYRWEMIAGALPPGLHLLHDGRIRGVPERAGPFTFTVGVSHSSGTFDHRGVPISWAGAQQERSYSIEIWEALRPALHLPLGRVGEPYEGGLLAAGLLPGEQTRWTGNVSGLSVSDDESWLDGRPSASGSFRVAYTIERDGEEVDRGEGQLRVLPPRPARSVGPALFHAWSEEPVDFAIPYTGLHEPVTVTSSVELPEGLRLDGGRLLGTPVQPGLTPIPVRVQDAVGTVATGVVTVRTGVARSPLQLQVPSSVHALVSQPFYFAPAASGGEGMYRWSLSGDRPAGLALDESGSLRGVIQQPGTWPLSLSLEDRITGERLSRSVLLVATRADSTAPTVLTRALPVALVDEQYNVELAAAGGIGAYTWDLQSRGTLPDGVTLTPSGLAGTPAKPGMATIEATVTDAVGQTDGPYLLRLVVSDPAEGPRAQLERAEEQIDDLRTQVVELENRPAEPGTPPGASQEDLAGETDGENIEPVWFWFLGILSLALLLLAAGTALGYYLGRKNDQS